MDVHILPSGYIETNAYLLTDAERKEGLLIDAPHGVWDDVRAILEREGCRLTGLWLTHGHWDHIGDVARIQAEGIPVSAHPADRAMIESPEIMKDFLIPGVSLEPARIDREFADGQRFKALGRSVEVRHVPGHCPGNVAFWFATEKAVFVGDALFAGGIGRTDLPGGSMEELARSIRSRLYDLPDDTVVCPGHGETTTIGHEKQNNPFVPA